MSLQNFIPTIWAQEILNTFEKSHVFASVVNRDYEGLITQQGDTVKINSVGPITVSNYVKNSTSITPEELDSAQTTLLIDQANYFAFQVDDVDKVQMNADVMGKAMQNSAYALSDTVDVALGKLYSQAGITVTDATCDSAMIFHTIAEAKQKLDENNVPQMGRWMVLPPWVITKLILAKLLTTDGSVNADGELANGVVGKILGFDIRVSNNIYSTGTAPALTSHAMAGVREAISYAEQIVSVEAYRPEAKFSDAVKGLHVYGYKVIKPAGLVHLELTYAAETT